MSKSESEMKSKEVQACPCQGCQMGQCHGCRMRGCNACPYRIHHMRRHGCGQCQFCQAGRPDMCPYASEVVGVLEGFTGKSWLSFNRLLLLLILILVIYIAMKHYKE